MSYSSGNFLKPIGSDKNIKLYDDNGSLTYTVKPTFITNVVPDTNLLKITLKSGKIITLDFINDNEPITAQSKLQQQIATLLQTNDYVDNVTQDVTLYVTAPYTYDTFLRPITDSDRNIKVLGTDLIVKYTIDPFNIANCSVSGNLLKINLKSNKVITLEFSTSNEAKLALIRLKEQIDVLTSKTPLTISKDIQNYIDSLLSNQGPVGPTGADGLQGPIGPTGADGLQGPVGPTGADGLQGPIGPTGADGLQGPIGPQGITGSSGNDGVQGIKGATGAGYYGTSTTEFTIPEIGYMREIQTQPNLGYTSDQWVIIASNTEYGEGEYYEEFGSPMFYALVDNYDSETGILNVVSEYAENVGLTFSQWFINLSGAKGIDGGGNGSGGNGATGATGPQGPQGATGPQGPTGTNGTIFWEKGTSISATDKTTDIYRTGAILIGSGLVNGNDRFVVSSSGGIISLVVDNDGNIYNYDNNYNTKFGYQSFYSNIFGTDNTVIGYQSLFSNNGNANTAIGSLTLFSNTTGSANTAVGAQSLYLNTTGYSNTAVGYQSLYWNTTGYSNTAIGYQSLQQNTTGTPNTAIGYNSLYFNTTGNYNTALGASTLFSNTTGTGNVAVGTSALYSNTTGTENVAIGPSTLYNNLTGNANIAIGAGLTLYNNTTGSNNTVIGYQTMFYNTTGYQNVALGNSALGSNTTGYSNTAIGFYSLYSNTTTVGGLGTISGGSGYVPGTYSVTLTRLSGSTANSYPSGVTVVVGAGGTVSSVTLGTNLGTGFKDTTTILTAPTANLGGGTGSGFSVAINSLLFGASNTAVGFNSLYSNTNGYSNTTIGYSSLYSNTTGYSNTATGYYTLYFNTTGYSNTALGQNSLYANTTGNTNTSIGFQSLYNNTTGYQNVALGTNALFSNTSGFTNIAVGNSALSSNTTGYQNTALGNSTLSSNTTGFTNIAIGYGTLASNITGGNNIAIGYQSLFSNTTGVSTFGTISGGSGYVPGTYTVTLTRSSGTVATTYPSGVTVVVGAGGTVSSVTLGATAGTGFRDTTTVLTAPTANLGGGTGSGFTVAVSTLTSQVSTAIGYQSMYFNTTGNYNTALGFQSLYRNSIGIQNTALGYNSLYNNTTGNYNTSVGNQSMQNSSTGSGNTAIGHVSLQNTTTGNYNTALGYFSSISNVTGVGNTSLGAFSLYYNTGNYNIAIGYSAGQSVSGSGNATASSNSIFIGYDTRPSATNNTNEIVIGYGATGNGSNTVTLGNNSVTNTYLKGIVNIGPIIETVTTTIGATASLVTYDFSAGDIWYHATASTNFTANFTNLPTVNGAITSTIIISQGATGYSPTVVQIAGVTQSVKWPNGTYSTSTNRVDVVGFTFIRSAGSWVQVLGQINSFS